MTQDVCACPCRRLIANRGQSALCPLCTLGLSHSPLVGGRSSQEEKHGGGGEGEKEPLGKTERRTASVHGEGSGDALGRTCHVNKQQRSPCALKA